MDKIASALEAHQAVILPTETVYGLFALALSQEAVEEVYHLKQRPKDKAMNLNVASYETILAFSQEQPAFLKELVATFLPGPLTIILKANDRVPHWINSGLETVGFRMPNHPKTLAYIQKFGVLIGPSANLSGQESGKCFQAIKKAFPSHLLGIADDRAIQGIDSTILDLSGKAAKILRQGVVTKEEISAKIKGIRFEGDNL